jgi:hypothetical protein
MTFDRFAWHRQFHGVKMPLTAARAAMALFDRADQTGQCWPGIDMLAADASLSRNGVRNGVDWLDTHGFVDKVARGGRSGDGQTRSTRYRLKFRTISTTTGVAVDIECQEPLFEPQQPNSCASTTTGVAPNRPENRPVENKPVVRGARTKGTYLPDDWSPTPEVVAQMRAQLPHINQELELEKFRDHWRSTTRNAMKRDWTATYRNWIRNAAKYAARNGAEGPTAYERKTARNYAVYQSLADPPPTTELDR